MALGTAFFAAAYLATTTVQYPQDGQRVFVAAELAVPGVENALVKIFHEFDPIPVTKTSPKHGWEFRFVTNGLVKTPESESFNLRFRTFAQSRKGDHDDIAQWTTRMLLRLWSYNYYRLGRDHPEAYRKLVDVYLCFGGDPGGEHLFDLDSGDLDSNNKPAKVNTFYIYQVAGNITPFQLCREIAHEYGHATLPGVGIYHKPENWANGDVGERIYLNWLYQDLKNQKLSPSDTMKVDLSALEKYVKEKVEPLVAKVGKTGPNLELLKKTDPEGDAKTGDLSKEAYDEYVALATYAANVLPPKILNKAMELGGQDATAFAKAVVEAVGQPDSWKFGIPKYLQGKALYLPIGKAKITGAKVLQTKGDWVKVQPLSTNLVVTNRPPTSTPKSSKKLVPVP